MRELRIRDEEDTGHYHSRYKYYCCSVTKRCPTLCPHGLQHARFPCPSLSPGLPKLMSRYKYVKVTSLKE